MAIIANIRPEQIRSITASLISADEAHSIVEKVGADTDIGAFDLKAQTLTSDIATGNPPLIVASTTNVENLNASSLNGATMAEPGAIGGTTPGDGDFAALSTTGQLTLGTEGTADGHCVSKAYVDARAAGLDPKESVHVATADELDNHAGLTFAYANPNGDDTTGVGATLTASGNGVVTIDGLALAGVGQRVLVKDQVDQTENGIYFVYVLGAVGATCILKRALDNDSNALMSTGSFVFVANGTENANDGYILSYNDNVATDWDAGGTDFVWTQFSGAGNITAGSGIRKAGDTLSLDEFVLQIDPDGSTAAFDLSNAANHANNIDVYLNGLLQWRGANQSGDYAVSLTGGGGGSTRITFSTTPDNADNIFVRWRR